MPESCARAGGTQDCRERRPPDSRPVLPEESIRPACPLFLEMEQKEEKPSEDGTTASPAVGAPGALAGGASAEEKAKGPAGPAGPPDGAGRQERASAEDGGSAAFQAEANGLDEVKVEAELPKEDHGKGETTAAPQELTDGNAETKPEPGEAEGEAGMALAPGKQDDARVAEPASREKAAVRDGAEAEPEQAVGEQEDTRAPGEGSTQAEEPKAKGQGEAGAPEAKSDPEKKTALEDEAEAQEADGKEEVSEAGGGGRSPSPGLESLVLWGCKQTPTPRPSFIPWGKSILPPTNIRAWGRDGSPVVPGCLPDLSKVFTKPLGRRSCDCELIQVMLVPGARQRQ